MLPSNGSSPDPRSGGSYLDWLARLVSSERFAVAFVWWAVLLTLAPACLICAVGFHENGAAHLGYAAGAVGLAVALVAARQLLSPTTTSRGSIPR